MIEQFGYADEIVERFPGMSAAVLAVGGIQNAESPPELLHEYLDEQRRVLTRLDGVALSEVPSIAAWRKVFSAFGVKPTKYRNAAESLLRRLTKKGDIPSINQLVDIGNLVSIRYGIPVAVMDQRVVSGRTTVQFADGTERFSDLGSAENVSPEPGEVIFADETGLVSARRWCWRQSAQSAAGSTTTEVLITIEAHHDGGRVDVDAAARDLVDLLARYQPQATVQTDVR